MALHQSYEAQVCSQFAEWERLVDGSFEAVFPALTLFYDPAEGGGRLKYTQHLENGGEVHKDGITLTLGTSLMSEGLGSAVSGTTIQLSALDKLRIEDPFLQFARLRFMADKQSSDNPLCGSGHSATRLKGTWTESAGEPHKLTMDVGGFSLVHQHGTVHCITVKPALSHVVGAYLRPLPRCSHLVRVDQPGERPIAAVAGQQMELVVISRQRQTLEQHIRAYSMVQRSDTTKEKTSRAWFPVLDTDVHQPVVLLSAHFFRGHDAYAASCSTSGKYSVRVLLAQPEGAGCDGKEKVRYDGVINPDYPDPRGWTRFFDKDEVEATGVSLHETCKIGLQGPRKIAVLAYPVVNGGSLPPTQQPFLHNCCEPAPKPHPPGQVQQPTNESGHDTTVIKAVANALRAIADAIEATSPARAPSPIVLPRLGRRSGSASACSDIRCGQPEPKRQRGCK